MSQILKPIYNYTFNKYNDNFKFKLPYNGTVLLTFEYSDNYRLENRNSTSLLWFNEFKNVKLQSEFISLDYDSINLSNERLEYFVGISIFVIEISIFEIYFKIKKLKK